MGYESLLFDVEDGVATITLNRPARHNAFNRAMAFELRDAWESVKRDSAIVCAIVTGAGEKAFCTGMDVADVAAGTGQAEGENERATSPFFHLTAIHNKCWKPVITAVAWWSAAGCTSSPTATWSSRPSTRRSSTRT